MLDREDRYLGVFVVELAPRGEVSLLYDRLTPGAQVSVLGWPGSFQGWYHMYFNLEINYLKTILLYTVKERFYIRLISSREVYKSDYW